MPCPSPSHFWSHHVPVPLLPVRQVPFPPEQRYCELRRNLCYLSHFHFVRHHEVGEDGETGCKSSNPQICICMCPLIHQKNCSPGPLAHILAPDSFTSERLIFSGESLMWRIDESSGQSHPSILTAPAPHDNFYSDNSESPLKPSHLLVYIWATEASPLVNQKLPT